MGTTYVVCVVNVDLGAIFSDFCLSVQCNILHGTEYKSLAACVGVSALGRTNIHFVDPSVKVNGQYYRDILLTRDLLPDIMQ